MNNFKLSVNNRELHQEITFVGVIVLFPNI